MSPPTAIIFGVGSVRGVGGGAVCKRFAREGYHVKVAGRTPAKIKCMVADIAASGVGSIEAPPTDAADRRVRPSHGAWPGSRNGGRCGFQRGQRHPPRLTPLNTEQFEAFWRVSCYSIFLVGREAERRLLSLGRGTEIFTGASGRLRGKLGLRTLRSPRPACA